MNFFVVYAKYVNFEVQLIGRTVLRSCTISVICVMYVCYVVMWCFLSRDATEKRSEPSTREASTTSDRTSPAEETSSPLFLPPHNRQRRCFRYRSSPTSKGPRKIATRISDCYLAYCYRKTAITTSLNPIFKRKNRPPASPTTPTTHDARTASKRRRS